MNDSENKLNTSKFKELRKKPSEYLAALSNLAIMHGLELAIKEIGNLKPLFTDF